MKGEEREQKRQRNRIMREKIEEKRGRKVLSLTSSPYRLGPSLREGRNRNPPSQAWDGQQKKKNAVLPPSLPLSLLSPPFNKKTYRTRVLSFSYQIGEGQSLRPEVGRGEREKRVGSFVLVLSASSKEKKRKNRKGSEKGRKKG